VPKLTYVAQNLKQAQVAVIDGEEDPSIHIQFSLDGYPFICYVHDGAIHVFDGMPDYDHVVKFATSEWKDVVPLSGPRNPFGWQMSVVGAITHFLWSVYEFITRNAALVGISPLVAFSVIFALLTVATLITIGCCVARYDDIVMPLGAEKAKAQKSAASKAEKPKASKAKEEEKPEEEKPKEKPSNGSLRQRKSAKGAKKID